MKRNAPAGRWPESARSDELTPAQGWLAMRRLAGLLGFDPDRAIELSLPDQHRLFIRLLKAQQTAGLSRRQFLELDRSALRAFCQRFGVSRLQVRFAQHMIALLWAVWRATKTGNILARQYHGRSTLQ